MRIARGVRLGALVLALGIALAACGGGGEESDGGTAAGGGATTEPQKVGLIFDVGGKGDLSFNDSAYKGLTEAKTELGDKITTTDQSPNTDGSNRKELVDGLISDEYGLVIGVGFAFSEDIAKAATESPETKFAVVDGFGCEAPNMRCLGFKEHEGSFLVGAAAALKTKSGKVGFVGGQEGDLIKKFQAGYEAGVEHVAKEQGKTIEVLVDYAGDTVQAFQDPAKGTELANKQIGQGADVIYHAAGLTGNGVINTAASKKVYAIGVDSDQSLTASDEAKKWILTSMLKRVDNSVKKAITDYVNGSFQGGFESLGLKEGGVDYAQNEFNKDLLGDIPTTLDELKQKIISGEITVPDKPAA
jgi:basic membrane protein A